MCSAVSPSRKSHGPPAPVVEEFRHVESSLRALAILLDLEVYWVDNLVASLSALQPPFRWPSSNGVFASRGPTLADCPPPLVSPAASPGAPAVLTAVAGVAPSLAGKPAGSGDDTLARRAVGPFQGFQPVGLCPTGPTGPIARVSSHSPMEEVVRPS